VIKNAAEPKSEMFTIELPEDNMGNEMVEYAKFDLNSEE